MVDPMLSVGISLLPSHFLLPRKATPLYEAFSLDTYPLIFSALYPNDSVSYSEILSKLDKAIPSFKKSVRHLFL